MKSIIATSKYLFDRVFDKYSIEEADDRCFISILDEDEESAIDTDSDNFLQVRMWDIERDVKNLDGIKYRKPPDDALKSIIDFVYKHRDTQTFIVHCSLGVSRSGAVAEYIRDKYYDDVNQQKFNEDNKFILPNKYIKTRLAELDNQLNKQ